MSFVNKDVIIGATAGAAAGVLLYELVRRGAFTLSLFSKAAPELSTTSSAHDGRVYETDSAVAEYLAFHFARDEELLPYVAGPTDALNFASRTAQLCVDWCTRAGVAHEAAFDVGCAVGRTSFDLSRTFQRVTGLDYSHAFVRAASTLQRTGHASCVLRVEGDIRRPLDVTLPEGVHADRITFIQGDACALPRDLGRFSVIHGANLLCRLPDPQAFLDRLPSLLLPRGLVVFVSPYSWLEQYTPKSRWLGGYVDKDGTPRYSKDGLTAAMTARGFTLLHSEDCPFLMREHARKFQWGCSHVTVWQLN